SPKQCWHDVRAGIKTRLTSNVAQARKHQTLKVYRRARHRKLPSWTKLLRSWTRRTCESDGSAHPSHRSRFANSVCVPKPSVEDEDVGRVADALAEAATLRHR